MSDTKPFTQTAAEKCNGVGLEAILEAIGEGRTQGEIASDLQISRVALSAWLNETPDRSAAVKKAIFDSAEAWTDRGLEAISNCEPTMVEMQRAKLLEAHCTRRAAQRNPKAYGSKVDVNATVGGELAITRIVREIMPRA